MHNKISEITEFDHGNRSMRKSKSTSNISVTSKKKSNQHTTIKTEIDIDNTIDTNKLSPNEHKSNGNNSPNNCRRRPKRSLINNNSLLSTVASVHELMSFVIYKDDPPSWLKQTDLYKEYKTKCQEINNETKSATSPPHCHQQLYRKERSNLRMYARPNETFQSFLSGSLVSPIKENRFKAQHNSNDSMHKAKRERTISPMNSPTQMMDLSVQLNISTKQDSTDENSASVTNKSKTIKQPSNTVTTRRQHLCSKKKPVQTITGRRQRVNNAENQEPFEGNDSSSSSSESDSNTSTSSSIEHTSPSPTTTVSASSSHRSSPTEYMRGNGSINARLSSPLRIQTSISPDAQTLSTPQRRSARIWAPSSFYVDPMWILPGTIPSKRLLVQNTSSSPSPPASSSTLSESNKRPRRRCRS